MVSWLLEAMSTNDSFVRNEDGSSPMHVVGGDLYMCKCNKTSIKFFLLMKMILAGIRMSCDFGEPPCRGPADPNSGLNTRAFSPRSIFQPNFHALKPRCGGDCRVGGWVGSDYWWRPPYNYNALVAPVKCIGVALLNPLTWRRHWKVVLGTEGWSKHGTCQCSDSGFLSRTLKKETGSYFISVLF